MVYYSIVWFTVQTQGSYSLLLRPKTRDMPETIVCGILMLLRSFGLVDMGRVGFPMLALIILIIHVGQVKLSAAAPLLGLGPQRRPRGPRAWAGLGGPEW